VSVSTALRSFYPHYAVQNGAFTELSAFCQIAALNFCGPYMENQRAEALLAR
jgi:hypothetical protein